MSVRWIVLAGAVSVAFSCFLVTSGCSPEAAPPRADAAESAKKAAVPLGLPPVPIPEDNPMTPEKIELGKLLYFDKRLSKDGTISCATCHDPKMAWAENEPSSTGIKKQVGDMNSPSIINTAYLKFMFWDGRMKTLEEQALGPMENPIEMGHTLGDIEKELGKIPEYQKRFQQVFKTGVTRDGLAKAIAAFERTVLSGNSPYDKFSAGDKKALNEVQQKGMDLFNKTGCADCHEPPIFSNSRFYNAGIGMDKPKPPEGRKSVTKQDADLGKFRVPPLREVAKTAPYFHDGGTKTLEEAVKLMCDGGKDNPNLSGMMKSMRDTKFSADDRKALVEFLKALSGEFPVVAEPKLP